MTDETPEPKKKPKRRIRFHADFVGADPRRQDDKEFFRDR